jgi:NADPH-dependent curcumin reductase CurA
MIFAQRPKGLPDASTFQLVDCAMPSPEAGEVLIQVTFLSVDPYMRGRLTEAKSYAAGWKLGEPGMGGLTGVVVESKHGGLKAGDAVAGNGPWRRYNVLPGASLRKIDTTSVPASAHLGVIGMPGLSAYFPTLEIGKPQKGETVFVSGAAGVVGLTCGQMCKLMGARVVGSAGTDAKCAYLKDECGFDEVFNYKTNSIGSALDKLCQNGIGKR